MADRESASIMVVVGVVAAIALVAMLSPTISAFTLQSPTGAVTGTQINVVKITSSNTEGKIWFRNEDGKGISIPIASDGSRQSGQSATESVFYSTDAKNNPDDVVYLQGESCTGSTLTDCDGAYFLVISKKKAHLFRITSIDTGMNEIDNKDLTYEQESNNNLYTDGATNSFQVGDITIQLGISEAGGFITFSSTGSAHGATVTLHDKATLEIINTNTASQKFEGLKFREYNDRALQASKYIGQEGSAPLMLDIFYDDAEDNAIEISSSILDDLGAAQGSGWFESNGDRTFYSNRGTLFTYDKEDKQKLTISHVTSTAAAKVKVKKTTPQAKQSGGWEIHEVDTVGDVGKDSSFVLDKYGYAHISYFDETNDRLKYAKQTKNGWTTSTIDTANTGRQSDIALDSRGNPHIVYSDTKKLSIKYAYYDGTWHKEALPVEKAILPAIALDANNEPHIVYYDFKDRDLVYLYKHDTWQTKRIDHEGDVGTDPSIVFDKDNLPHVVYYDNQYDYLKYAWHDNELWKTATIDMSGTAGLYSKIEMDDKSRPVIWYYNKLRNKVQYFHYLGNNQWDQKTFSLEGLDLYRGDILLDDEGMIHFSYYHPTNRDMKYAVGYWE